MFLPRPGHNPAFPLPESAKIRPDNFCATAWLCTRVNGARFQSDAGAKTAFSRETLFSNNGERARSLLCGREALAKPPGAAGSLLNAGYLSCVRQTAKRDFDALKFFWVSGEA
ncbi:hypothetical protein [Enterobacter hormaechei]|uniref:hypothetical protein n=1 Tax=Enterobacter hormaechei TaxID=158836 RepID=UPI0012AFC8FA|nr:hypothetical protein [Enterobacter hormaechei]